MIWTVASALLFIALACVVWKWVRVRRYWLERGLPHDAPHPFLGSLTFLQKENPVFWMRRIYNKFKSPYVGVWLFWQPALVINSPQLAKKILVKDAGNFRNRFLSSGKTDPIGNLNLFTVNDPIWISLRRRLTAVFTASKLRSLEGLVKQKGNDLVERYKEEMIKNPDDINVRVINSDYTTDVIGEAAFGVNSQATRTGDSALRSITRDLMRFDVLRGIAWSSIFFFPSLVDVFGFSLFPKNTTRFLRKLFRNIVEQRGGFDKPVKEPKDLLDSLLKMRQDAAKDNEDMDEDLLLAQAAVFLQAGFDTSGSALTYAFKELAHSPEIQERLYEDLKQARENLGRDFDSNDFAEMPFLNAVIKEILRKYPAMGWLDRVSIKPYKLDDNYTMPAGMPLYVNAAGLHMDPEYFPEPEKFDPDRFMPENEKNIIPYTYMPFGEGPRMCIGMRFAHLSMRYALATVVRNFVIRAPEGALSPNEWPVERRGFLLGPDGKVQLIFTVRH